MSRAASQPARSPAPAREAFLSDLAALPRAPGSLAKAREAGRRALDDLDFPSARDEAWRHTRVAPIAATRWKAAGPAGGEAVRKALAPYARMAGARLVFANGRCVAELSRPGEGVEVGSLAALPAKDAARIGSVLGESGGLFGALNAAFLADGAFVRIRRRSVAPQPVLVLFVGVPSGSPEASHPRVLLLAEEESEAAVLEAYEGTGGGEGAKDRLVNAVTEISLGAAARLEHCRLVREGAGGIHLGLLAAEQGRDSTLRSHAVILGGEVVRSDVRSLLAGEGASCDLAGLYVAGGAEHVDCQTMIDHAVPRTTANELYKGILDGRSTAVFNGGVVVRKDAQKTDSRQANRNLLLSEEATIHTKPQLEILADDVRCSHGATIGQLEEQELFYLRSRGMDRADATNLLIAGFAGEIVDGIRSAPVRERLDAFLVERLPGHIRIHGERP